MSGSSSSINYNVRPCKSVERKMMCELIGRLSSFDHICNYRYLGMGAKYFTDFSLLHREFGIKDMHSMEINSSENNIKRFEFNRPFNCINVLFGNSSDLLCNKIDWWDDNKTIVWLDYDGGFNHNQLQDVETCISRSGSGSVVFVSFNSDFGNKFKEAEPKEKLEIFKERIDNEVLVTLLKPKDIAKENIYCTINKMFDLVVKNSIAERNRLIEDEEEKLNAKQIVYFKYNDSKAIMLTLGWIVYKNKDAEKVDICKFSELDFCNPTNVPYDISVPNLTYKELSVLNKNMPEANFPIKEAEFFQEDEVESFKKIYRYYPATFEIPNLL